LTNNHVVAGATSVAVTLYRQTEQRQATVISTDPANDLALIKINGVSGLPRVNLGNSATVQQGDSVLAIGNALALAGGPTVTEGIVSALGRSLSARDPVTLASEHLTGLIQTDAPINPGNSGGPLVSSNGNVIGMNTAVATSSTGNAPAENVGFAIAVNTIKALLPQLRRSNITVTPASAGGYMGVVVTDATPVVREQMGIVAHSGAVVISVGPGSPAQRAGIRSADVIVAVNNTPVATAADLAKILKRLRPGDRVAVTLERGGRRLQVQVVLEARPGYVP
jgi:S1-C subfamily serine protease